MDVLVGSFSYLFNGRSLLSASRWISILRRHAFTDGWDSTMQSAEERYGRTFPIPGGPAAEKAH